MKHSESIGVVLDDQSFDVVSLKKVRGSVMVQGYEHREFPVPLRSFQTSERSSPEGKASDETDSDPGDIFGLEPDSGSPDSPPESSIEEELNLDMPEGGGELDIEGDILDEAGIPERNDQLLFETIRSITHARKARTGFTIRAGVTQFQSHSDRNFAEMKQKALGNLVKERVKGRLGDSPDPDAYRFCVDESARLWIATLDREPASIDLFNQMDRLTKKRSIFIDEIYPDEIALIQFYLTCYKPSRADGVTALVQCRRDRTRLLFMYGKKWIHHTLVQEGTADKSLAGTLFSKLLLQIDTGEIPGLDRVLICDEPAGMDLRSSLAKQFPEVTIESFQVPSTILTVPKDLMAASRATTALAIAHAVLEPDHTSLGGLTMRPSYIDDRQKLFKLEWHGVAILLAIGLMPILMNSVYQETRSEIDSLETERDRLITLIADLEETVALVDEMEASLISYQQTLEELFELSSGTLRWTRTLDHLNRSVEDVGQIWITNYRYPPEGLVLEGLALQEDRIPQLARRFSRVTLIQVRQEEVRERPIYRFSMRIADVFPSPDSLNPPELQEIQQFLEQSAGGAQ